MVGAASSRFWRWTWWTGCGLSSRASIQWWLGESVMYPHSIGIRCSADTKSATGQVTHLEESEVDWAPESESFVDRLTIQKATDKRQ